SERSTRLSAAPAETPYQGSPLAHRVAATGHARPERTLVVAAPLRHRGLLLPLIVLLGLLLFFHLVHPSDATEERTHTGTDGRTPAAIAADGATDRAERRADGRAPDHATLWRLILGRRGGHRHLRIRGVEATLLHRPAVALASIELLLLRA